MRRQYPDFYYYNYNYRTFWKKYQREGNCQWLSADLSYVG